jgi:hypothetical protein
MALFSMELASCIASISNTTTLVLTKKKTRWSMDLEVPVQC